MSEQVQEAGAATTEAGGTQNDAGQKPAGEGAVASGEAPEGAKPAEEAKATEEVSYDFEVPDGVELDSADTDEFKGIAKELKLSKDAAQKVLNLAIKREQARAQAFTEQVKSWGEALQKDPELGKPEVQAAARKTVETFGDDELRSLLNSTGMGNHPAVVRFVAKISKAMSEDTFVAGRSGGETKKDAATILYGKP